MSAVFIDTAVIMYAAGQDHPLRAPSGAVMQRVADGTLDAVISAEVVQEILHRFSALRDPDRGRIVAGDALDLFAPVLALTHPIMQRAVALRERYRAIPARDLVHVATCIEEGIDAIVSPDAHYSDVQEITRLALDDVLAL